MLVCVIAQLGVHYTNIALYNIVCNMQKEKTRVRAPIFTRDGPIPVSVSVSVPITCDN